MRTACLTTLVLLLTTAAINGQPPPGSAVKILSPRFFPGWQAQNVAYPFVVYDDTAGHYKMYYAGTGATYINYSIWDQQVTGYVTSTNTDLTSWRYPDNYEQVLFARKCMEGDLLDPDEMAGIFDSVFAIGACVLKDGSTFKCWYTGWNGEFEHLGGGLSKKINYRIGYATSPDGITWTKYAGSAGAGAVLGLGDPGQQDAKGVAHPHVIKEDSTYRLWYQGYDGSKWRILYATSSDGTNWTKQGVALNPGTSGALDELGLCNPVAITRDGDYELWYQGQSTSSPNYHVMRARSNNGTSWTKLGEVTLHPVAPSKTPWPLSTPTGSEQIFVDSIIVLPDNSCQVFFAKQYTSQKSVTYGTFSTKRYYIYTEVVDP